MEIRNLQAFLAVAETLSFTKAARSLNYAQSSVTAQIQSLEAELGVPLFERLGKRVVRTEAGDTLREYARKLLQLEEEARTAVAHFGAPSGTLTLGAPESLCTYRLPTVLSRFHARYSKVQLAFRPGWLQDRIRGLEEGTIDLAFILDQSTEYPGLVTEWLWQEPIRILAHPDHPLCSRETVTPLDLEGEAVLGTEEGCPYRKMFERALASSGIHPETTIEFTSIEAIKLCARAGMGLAVLPEVAVESELKAGTLVALPWHDRDFSLSALMAWHQDKWLSPALRAFVEIVRSEFQ